MKLLPLLCLLSPWFGPGSAQEIRPGVVTVAENADALLPCSLSSKQKVEKFDWRKDNGEYDKKEVFFYERGSHYKNGRPGQDEQFKDRVLFFEDELKAGNASIKIKRTHLKDNGTYICVLFEPYRQEFSIRLNVDGVLKIRNITGAAPVPHIKPTHGENTWSVLECQVQGVPKPEVEWRSSAGKVLQAKEISVTESQDGRFHIELQVNVTKTDNYSCVATQRGIFHQINNTLYMYIQGKKSDPDYSTEFVITVAVVPTVISLLVAAIIIGVQYAKIRSIKGQAGPSYTQTMEVAYDPAAVLSPDSSSLSK